MNGSSSFTARFLSAPEYVCALHEPSDQVAVLVRNRSRQPTTQRILAAETIASVPFQSWHSHPQYGCETETEASLLFSNSGSEAFAGIKSPLPYRRPGCGSNRDAHRRDSGASMEACGFSSQDA